MVYEILDEFKRAPTRSEKIKVLRENNTLEFETTLRLVFDPRVHFVPMEIPPYKPLDTPPGMGYTSIFKELPRMYIFVENSPEFPKNLPAKRRKEILIQILEALEPKEAQVFVGILQKNLGIEESDAEIIKEAYPNLLNKQYYEQKTQTQKS